MITKYIKYYLVNILLIIYISLTLKSELSINNIIWSFKNLDPDRNVKSRENLSLSLTCFEVNIFMIKFSPLIDS